MLNFKLLHPPPGPALGYIPQFLSPDDPRPARDQFDNNYKHGGGWRPMSSWQLNTETAAIRYPGDPPLKPIAKATLREETIYIYPHAWVAIVQPDGQYEIARLD